MSDLLIRRKAPDGAAAAHTEAAQSPRERLRARRERLARGSRREFVLPGYDTGNEELGGQLVATYRRLGLEELEEAFRSDRWKGTDGRYDVVAANAQFLADACENIAIREPDGTVTPLVDGHPTTYTVNLDTGQSLATVMGVEHLNSLRAQMIACFGDNELALNDHSGEVHRWMVSANAVDVETAVGEPRAR